MTKESIENYVKFSEVIQIDRNRIKSISFLMIIFSLFSLPATALNDKLILFVIFEGGIWLLFCVELLVIRRELKKNVFKPIIYQCIMYYTLLLCMITSSGLILYSINMKLAILLLVLITIFTIAAKFLLVKHNLMKDKYKDGFPVGAELGGTGLMGIAIFGVRPILVKTIKTNDQAFLIMSLLIFFSMLLLTFLENNLYQIYFARKYIDKDYFKIKE